MCSRGVDLLFDAPYNPIISIDNNIMKTQILIAAAVASTAGAFSVSVSKNLHMLCEKRKMI